MITPIQGLFNHTVFISAFLKENNMMKKTWNWVGNLVIAFLIIMIAFLFITSPSDSGQPSSIMGYQMMAVLSGSMEPALHPGDIVVIKQTDSEQIRVDDIITYASDQNTVVTHRVIDVVQKDGQVLFETKGDANNRKDDNLVSGDQVIGSLQFHIPKAGSVIDFIKSPLGVFLVITGFVFFLGMKPLLKLLESSKLEDKEINRKE